MTGYLISLTLVIAAVLVIRAVFKKTVSPRYLYILWIAVVLRLVIPVSLFEVGIPTNLFPDDKPAAIQTEAPQHVPPHTPYVTDTVGTDGYTVPAASEAVTPTEREPLPEMTALSAKAVLSIVWASGAVLCAGWFAVSGAVFGYRLKKGRRYVGKKENIPVYVSPYAKTTCIVGLVPVIYLTPEAEASESREYILNHEYTHFRHGDTVWALLRLAALAVHWYNPLVWAAAILSKHDGELACDDAVASRLSDGERLEYARTVLEAYPQKTGYVSGLGGAPVRKRINALVKRPVTRPVCAVLAAVLTVLCVGCSLGEYVPRETESTLPPVSEEAVPADTTVTEAEEPAPVEDPCPTKEEWDALGLKGQDFFYPVICALLKGDVDEFTSLIIPLYDEERAHVYDDMRGMKIGDYKLYTEDFLLQGEDYPATAFPILEFEVLESGSEYFRPGTHRLVFRSGMRITFTEYDEFIKEIPDMNRPHTPVETYIIRLQGYDFSVLREEHKRQFGLCDFIVARMNDITGDYSTPRTEEEIRAYAEKYLSVPGDSLDFGNLYPVEGGYALIGRGIGVPVFDVLSEEERDGMTVWTVKFWADYSRSVPARITEFHLKYDGYEYTPVKTVVVKDWGKKPISEST